ncbi:MAG: hypothetical protein Q7U36_00660 [bacterium]|nr:hypothetical protein [bacterium]
MISSGRHNAQIVIGIVWLVPIHIRAIRIGVTEVEEIAIRRSVIFCLTPSKATSERMQQMHRCQLTGI